MAAMIEPRKDDEMDPVASELAGLGNRVSVLEVKVDVLGTKVDEGFKRVDERFEQIDQRFEKVDERFGKVEDELKGMQRLMVQGVIALSSSMVVGFAAMATVMVAKL